MTKIVARVVQIEDDMRDVNQEGGDSSVSWAREEERDAYSEPACREGVFVMILNDTRPGVSFKFSYDKGGRVTQAIDGDTRP